MPSENETRLNRRAWFFQIIEEFLNKFMDDNQSLLEVTEQVVRLERNEREGYVCRHPGCAQTYQLHSGRVR